MEGLILKTMCYNNRKRNGLKRVWIRINYGYDKDMVRDIFKCINEIRINYWTFIKLHHSLKENKTVRGKCTALYDFLVESGTLEDRAVD